MTQTIISVIIPDKYRPEYAIQAIQSIYLQKVPQTKIQIILVRDNNPEYPEHQIKKRFPNVKIITNEDKEGPGGSRNTGVKHADGEFIAFLDSDDQWEPEFLSASFKAFADPRCGATMCLIRPFFYGPYPATERLKVWLINSVRQLALIINFILYKGYISKDFFWVCQLSHSVFRRSAIDKYRFDYQYRRGGEDWGMYTHVLKSHQIKIVPRKLVKFRYEIGSSTNQKINQQNKWASYLKLRDNLPINFKKGLGFKLFDLYLNVIKPR